MRALPYTLTQPDRHLLPGTMRVRERPAPKLAALRQPRRESSRRAAGLARPVGPSLDRQAAAGPAGSVASVPPLPRPQHFERNLIVIVPGAAGLVTSLHPPPP